MQIANPIYDIVFKYLLDDNKIAKLIISALIEEEIIDLKFLPQERRLDIETQSLTVYRLDFSAKIQTQDGGYKHVIIEIQKAKYPTDIMRFRKYLGEQYVNEENMIRRVQKGIERKEALPIVSIYFLGHRLQHTEAPVIMVRRKYIEQATRREIKEKEEFIESLTHDSVIVQIPYLKEKRRNDLEKLLSVFDQSAKTRDHHILQIKEEEYPARYRLVIRRLQRAIEEPKVRDTMDLEDEILEELENKDRALARKEELIKEKDKVIEENKKVIAEKDKLIEELKKQLR